MLVVSTALADIASGITGEFGITRDMVADAMSDNKKTDQLFDLMSPEHCCLWAMNADMTFEGFDWNGLGGLRVQTSGFRTIVAMDFVRAEQLLRNLFPEHELPCVDRLSIEQVKSLLENLRN